MPSLTTRQRDLIQLLINSTNPVGIIDMADRLDLSQRQVNYELNRLKTWFQYRNMELIMKPGVGVNLENKNGNVSAIDNLKKELRSSTKFTLVLSSKQRQQLLTFIFLNSDEPIILTKLEHLFQISRTTVLKDIEVVEKWLYTSGLKLSRKQNYGFWIDSSETLKRQGMAALIWGETNFGTPLITLTIADGLQFSLSADADYLPALTLVNNTIRSWDIKRMLREVAYAEAQISGRFIDDAVLFLSLVFAINLERVLDEKLIAVNPETIQMLKNLPIWSVSHQVLKRLVKDPYFECPEEEIAGIAMYLLSASRNGRWPGDLEINESFTHLIDNMMAFISDAYNLPNLTKDITLRDGIVIHIVPACLRQRFQIWYPKETSVSSFTNQYVFEEQLARDLRKIIEEKIEISLPDKELDNLAMLLRAAYIRENENRVENVIVVCPSGMATAQFLVARLKVRFPRLSNLTVVSLRDLKKSQNASADLVISTIPITQLPDTDIDVIIVHPLLLPEDIEAITQWLNMRPLLNK